MDTVVRQMDEIRRKGEYIGNLVTACYGIYQLLQSLTALEAAPTKKYDFYSIYYPLETLVHILKERCCSAQGDEELAENELLYEFIHKISMTLHGTLRTDIQFFQIRDFNATLHYAPAKLRAYYTLFVFMLSAHIKEVSSVPSEMKKHSYIFCPGLFKEVSVKQLFSRPEDEKRLMLITVPERYLYFPENLSIILAHEVGHLAGEGLRNRKVRHRTFLECSYRILCLELTKLAMHLFKNVADSTKKKESEEEVLQFHDSDMWDALLAENECMEGKEEDKVHMYYSEPSKWRIRTLHEKIRSKYGRMYFVKYSKSLMQEPWRLRENEDRKEEDKYSLSMKSTRGKYIFCDSLVDTMTGRWYFYNIDMLPDLLTQIHYLLSEPVSDILAILIYGLNPMEYLHSVAEERMEGQAEVDMGITKVRIALVINVMKKLAKKYEKLAIRDLLENWDDVYRKINLNDMQSDSVEFGLIAMARDYENSLSDKLVHIEGYESTVNQDKNVVTERVYDYLNDSEIFDDMSEYLLVCGEEYVRRISENSQYSKSREIVRKAFRKCAGDTPIDLMEQVDMFLYHFEKEWKDEYFCTH